MAIYHCAIKIISRGKGMSALGACAYRSGEVLQNEYDGVIHDFTRKRGIVYTEILLPSHAPPEFADRSTLWNSVERIEKSKNSQLAREIEVALPIELDREEQIRLVRGYVQENFVSAGMCADIAIHDKKDGNPHAHIMLTMRPLEQSGEWGGKSKKEYVLDKSGQRIKLKDGGFKSRKVDTVDWNDRGNAERWRKAWADCINCSLVEQDIQEKVDHRSYKRQGKEQIPTIHAGVSATQMERRGMRTERGEKNRRIRERNRRLKEVRGQIERLEEWLHGKGVGKEGESVIFSRFMSASCHMLPELLNTVIRQNGRYGKMKDVKSFEKATSFLQENNVSTLPELKEMLSEIKMQCQSTSDRIKRTEKLIRDRRELINQAKKYLQYRDCHKVYKQIKPKEQADFAERYRMELALYDRAERYLKEHLKSGSRLKLNVWEAGLSNLITRKECLYQEMRRLRNKIVEIETVKRCVEQIIQPNEQRREKTRGQEMPR